MTREHNGERRIRTWPDLHHAVDIGEKPQCAACNGSGRILERNIGNYCPETETPRNAGLFAKLDALREATFGSGIERCVCGGQPHTVYGGRESWYVDCADCAWSGDYADTEAGAIDAWNSVMRAARERDELRTILATAQEDARLSHEYAQRVRDEHAETIRELRIELEAAKTERDDARSMVGKLRTELEAAYAGRERLDSDRDHWHELAANWETEADRLRAELEAVKTERDSERENARCAMRSLRQHHIELEAERIKCGGFEYETVQETMRRLHSELAAERARPRPKVTLREAEGAAVQWYLEES